MQSNTQVMPVPLALPSTGTVSGIPASSRSQAIDISVDTNKAKFTSLLDDSFQELALGEVAPLLSLDQAQLLATVEQYLAGELPVPGGNGMPSDGSVAAGELTADLRELMERLKNMLANGALVASPASVPPAMLETTAVADAPAAQLLLDQRRLLERFQSLPEFRRLTDMASGAQIQPDGGQGAALLLAGTTVDESVLQLTKMAELNTLALSLKEGVMLDSRSAGGSDMNGMATTSLSRQSGGLSGSADLRPATTSSYIHVPLGNPQWQSDFSSRVTWLARAGGNQSAEIRINPANLGPIEVKVMMKDDQASITFTAQHGVVRDAIEASLPRLREMFLSSGMQLAQANVSDQPFQEPRQRQQSGTEGDRSQDGHGQPDEFGEASSVTALSSMRSTEIVERVDLYV